MKTIHKRAVLSLNSEIEFQRRGKKILLNTIMILLAITVAGPIVFLILLDNDFVYDLIDGVFDSWKFQLYSLIVLLLITNFIYIRWKFLRK